VLIERLTDYITEQPWEDTITAWFVWVDDAYQRIVTKRGRRFRGEVAQSQVFADSEVITVSFIIETFFMAMKNLVMLLFTNTCWHVFQNCWTWITSCSAQRLVGVIEAIST